jgi:hypothetical protein
LGLCAAVGVRSWSCLSTRGMFTRSALCSGANGPHGRDDITHVMQARSFGGISVMARARGGARQGRGPLVAVAVGVGLLAVGAALVVRYWAREGTAAANSVASVVAGLIACVGPAVTLTGWLLARRRSASLPPTQDQIGHAAASLASAVREQWLREAQIRCLGDPGPIPVRWHLA